MSRSAAGSPGAVAIAVGVSARGLEDEDGAVLAVGPAVADALAGDALPGQAAFERGGAVQLGWPLRHSAGGEVGVSGSQVTDHRQLWVEGGRGVGGESKEGGACVRCDRHVRPGVRTPGPAVAGGRSRGKSEGAS